MEFETISTKQIEMYQNRSDVVIIDLRDTEDYCQGHVPSAISIPFESLYIEITPYRNKIILLYCDRGGASLMAARELSRRGYSVINISGGFHLYRGTVIQS